MAVAVATQVAVATHATAGSAVVSPLSDKSRRRPCQTYAYIHVYINTGISDILPISISNIHMCVATPPLFWWFGARGLVFVVHGDFHTNMPERAGRAKKKKRRKGPNKNYLLMGFPNGVVTFQCIFHARSRSPKTHIALTHLTLCTHPNFVCCLFLLIVTTSRPSRLVLRGRGPAVFYAVQV